MTLPLPITPATSPSRTWSVSPRSTRTTPSQASRTGERRASTSVRRGQTSSAVGLEQTRRFRTRSRDGCLQPLGQVVGPLDPFLSRVEDPSRPCLILHPREERRSEEHTSEL